MALLYYPIAAFGIWPALPLSGYWLYVWFCRPAEIGPLPKATLFALIGATGIAAFSLPMLLAATLHLYKGEYFGLIGWGITVLSVWRLSGKGREYFAIHKLRLTGWDLVLTIGLVVAGLLYAAFPTETILGGRDEGVYANHGIYIAQHGRVDLSYPYPEDLAPLFKEAVHRFPAKHKTFVPGFYLTSPTIKVQFGHLFPVWLAQTYSTFGHHGLFRLNGFLALLSVCIFYGLCCLVIPKPYAVAATLFLALNPSQIWLARITLTEILTQLFIWSGLLLLGEALKQNRKMLARWAGIFLGFSAVTRIDCFFVLPLVMLSHLGLKILEEPKTEGTSSIWPAFYQSALSLFGFAAGYYALFSTPYFVDLYRLVLWIGVLSLCFFLAFRWPINRFLNALRPYLTGRPFLVLIGIALVALTAYAYWVRPHMEPYLLINWPGHPNHGTRDYCEDSLINLAQYVSPVVIWTMVMGWLMMLWNMVRHRRYVCFSPILVVTFGFSILYLWRPFISPQHFWAIRRFVPVIIPGMILFSAFGAWQMISRTSKISSVTLSVLILMFLSLFTLKSNALIYNFAENKGSFRQIEQLANHLPKDQIILSDPGIYPPTWETPLYVSFDRKIVPVDLNSPEGINAARGWFGRVAAENGPFYLLYEGKPLVKGLESTKIYEMELTRHLAELVVHPLPKRILKEERTIGLYKISGIVSNYTNLRLGSEKYFGVTESGFYSQSWDGSRLYRWTDGNAKLIVPIGPKHLPRSLRASILSHCPKELEFRILVDNHELYQGWIGPGKSWTDTLKLSHLPLKDKITVEIISDTFVPRELIKGSEDGFTLGVTIHGIELLEND